MRLLVDNNLSPRLVTLLADVGWNVLHVRDLGLGAAPDPVVLAAARDEARILVSADTDFGGLLARTHEPGPSVVLVRRLSARRADALARVLVANLPLVAEDLDAGCVVALEEDTMRIRSLPL